MYLSEIAILLSYWNLCNFCVTFATDPFANNRFAGFYALDHDPVFFNPLPAFNRLNIGGHNDENENETNNAASESDSEDDNGSDISISEDNNKSLENDSESESCHTIEVPREDSDGTDNLIYAYYYLTLNNFDEYDENYKYTYGYYMYLIKEAINLESSEIWTLPEFCRERFKNYDVDICVDYIEESGVKGAFSGLQAYEFMYFTLDYTMLNLKYLFPDVDTTVHSEEYLYENKVAMVDEYFRYLSEQYDNLNTSELNSPLEYCTCVCNE